eukprot:2492368-Pyramimonas_sp.AAC.1
MAVASGASRSSVSGLPKNVGMTSSKKAVPIVCNVYADGTSGLMCSLIDPLLARGARRSTQSFAGAV